MRQTTANDDESVFPTKKPIILEVLIDEAPIGLVNVSGQELEKQTNKQINKQRKKPLGLSLNQHSFHIRWCKFTHASKTAFHWIIGLQR